MNTLTLQREYVRNHLEDRVAARALVDLHEEESVLTHAQALRVVALLRRQERNSKELSAAAQAMAASNKTDRSLGLACVAYCGRSWEDDPIPLVVIVSGSRPPTLAGTRGTLNGQPRPCILVGARWIIRAAAAAEFFLSIPPKVYTAVVQELLFE